MRKRTDQDGTQEPSQPQAGLRRHSSETCSWRPAGTARLSRRTQGCSLGSRWKCIRDDEKQTDHVAAPFRVTYVPTAQDAGEEGSEVLPTADHGWTLHTNLQHEQKVPEAADWHADSHTVWRW